jgi:polyisoprenyl-phosphate glycosyltransferase
VDGIEDRRLNPPALSIVAPIYNEARILAEFVARCLRAAEQCGLTFELVIVDDASTDDTPALLADLARDHRVRQCRLPGNVGQFRATQMGLREARGGWVAVLDGDLQDPPEHIPRLVGALSAAAPTVLAVLAVKVQRDDPSVFMIGQFLFHRLQHALSCVALPRGAGSYCLMRSAVAQRVAMAELRQANLAAVVAVAASVLGGELTMIPYDKGARYDRSTRVGWRGLITEALESLAITGALSRMLGLVAIALGASALAAGGYPVVRAAMLGAGALGACLSLGVGLRARRALASVRASHSSDG